MKVQVVQHTHWDREWYFTVHDSLVLLDGVLLNVLQELNDNPNANFCLDGQISIILDFLKIRPECQPLMQKFVDEKRLFVGPWFSQTDTRLVSGESIVHNLYYGITESENLFKNHMKIGYLPDTFGFSNQLPMILKGFGIENCIIWRGVSSENTKPYFKWASQDDDYVSTVTLHRGYGMAKNMDSSKEFIKETLLPILNEYGNLIDTDLLLPIGNDQFEIKHNLDQTIEKINNKIDHELVLSSYEKFFDTLDKGKLSTYSGELIATMFARVHLTSGGIRQDIKQSNYKGEISLSKVIEPLVVLAKSHGIDVNQELVYLAWSKLLESQSHDSIVGCVSDDVANDIVSRNRHALEISHSIQNLVMKKIADTLDLDEDEVIVFNLETKEFSGLKEIEILTDNPNISLEGVDCQVILSCTEYSVDNEKLEGGKTHYLAKILAEVNLPSFGYKTYRIIEGGKQLETSSQNVIQNQFHKVKFENGKLIYNDSFEDFILLEEEPNAGDTYDFSPTQENDVVTLSFDECEILNSKLCKVMKLKGATTVPRNRLDANSQSVALSYELHLSLIKEKIHAKVIINNNVLSHRIRVSVNSIISSKCSIASTPFGYLRREISPHKNQSWKETHVECPIDIYATSGFVTLESKGLAPVIFTKGIKEFQVSKDRICLTLLSTTSKLGKANLEYRPGRASGDIDLEGHVQIFTPNAECQGTYEFEFAFEMFETDIDTAYKKLYQYETPSVSYQNQKINKFVKRIDNKIQEDPFGTRYESKNGEHLLNLSGDVIVSQIYTSKRSGEPFLRVFSTKSIEVSSLQLNGETVELCDLLENKLSDTILKPFKLYSVKGFLNNERK